MINYPFRFFTIDDGYGSTNVFNVNVTYGTDSIVITVTEDTPTRLCYGSGGDALGGTGGAARRMGNYSH